jgi:hypothetical protein
MNLTRSTNQNILRDPSMTTRRHRQHIEKAKTDLTRAAIFGVVTEDSRGEIEYTYSVDTGIYPDDFDATSKRLSLLGNHIRFLAAELDASPEQTVALALDASRTFEMTDI